MKKISIVIVNYYGEKNTEELLISLSKISCQNFQKEIIIINNSIPAFHYHDLNHDSEIRYIDNEKNIGFATANNQGIKLALQNGADYVCLLNNDTTVEKDFLQNLFNYFEKNDKVGVASPKIYFSAGREFHKNKYKKDEQGRVIWYAGGHIDWQNVYCSHQGVDQVDTGQFDKVIDTDFATGCCMMIRKEVFEKIGFFFEEYFAYFEDVDFCVRAKKAGFEIKYISESVIWHKNASSSGGSGSHLQFFLQERNRIYFGFKYANTKAKLHLIKKTAQYFFSKNYKISLSLIKMFI